MNKEIILKEKIKINTNSTNYADDSYNYLIEMTKGLKMFFHSWAELNDFFTKLSVMNGVSSMKSEVQSFILARIHFY